MLNCRITVVGFLAILALSCIGIGKANAQSTRTYKQPSPEMINEFQKDPKKYRKYLLESLVADQIDSVRVGALYRNTKELYDAVNGQYESEMLNSQAADERVAKLKVVSEWYASQMSLLQDMARMLQTMEFNSTYGWPKNAPDVEAEYERTYTQKLKAFKSLLTNPPS